VTQAVLTGIQRHDNAAQSVQSRRHVTTRSEKVNHVSGGQEIKTPKFMLRWSTAFVSKVLIPFLSVLRITNNQCNPFINLSALLFDTICLLIPVLKQKTGYK
jgi:hypothetical protein